MRIELGPDDAQQNTCIVARCQAVPGKVAYKRTCEIGKETCDVVREMLQMADADVPEGEVEKYRAGKQPREAKQCASTHGFPSIRPHP